MNNDQTKMKMQKNEKNLNEDDTRKMKEEKNLKRFEKSQ